MKTPITYYGGKQYMLRHIRPLVPAHNLYYEPFAGGDAVLFDKEPAPINVINDLNGELINFYRVAKERPAELGREIAPVLHSRAQFDHACYIYRNPLFLTPVQRAAALWLLSKVSFAWKLGQAFGFEKTKSKNPRKLANAKLAFCDEPVRLLKKATIECDDAFNIIRRYDTPGTFFFLDPPYAGTGMGHYAGMFSGQELVALLEFCGTLQGKFMLTTYPNETVRSAANCSGWAIHPVKHPLIAAKAGRVQEEWIVCNYTL
jgi:DNA adenine methylase